ncbi:MAG: trypsin-like peptidase domain-containing protein [Anaerolineales bacterium]|jgi:2-alkenal reductase|nr:trypsin-like peptidase domain-containing protein [Anaerolineales bacterium]
MKNKNIVLASVVLILAMLACQTPVVEIPTELPVIVTEAAQPVNSENPGVVVSNPAAQQESLVTLYENTSPGTVAIFTVEGQGSGFVYDTNGHIVTNFHVIDGALNPNEVEVRFNSGFMAKGTVIGTDLDSDIAVVKVDAPADKLFPVPLGDSNLLKVGQTVVAIGNPFGLESTMTVGIISALGRTLDSANVSPEGGSPFSAGDIIQTDAAINPGNSGGPLFNINGEVIGVNRAIRTTNFTETGQPVNSGIGFAISINMVKRVVPELIAKGTYEYPFLGISSINTLSLDMVNALGLSEYPGAYVTGVVTGGPAEQAGIKPGTNPTNFPGLSSGGDLIVAIDGKPTRTFDEMLSYLVTNKSPGDIVVLTVVRGTERVDVSITLGARP